MPARPSVAHRRSHALIEHVIHEFEQRDVGLRGRAAGRFPGSGVDCRFLSGVTSLSLDEIIGRPGSGQLEAIAMALELARQTPRERLKLRPCRRADEEGGVEQQA